MKKLHLTHFAAMASIALMGTTAAWGGDADFVQGNGWYLTGDNLMLFSFPADPEDPNLNGTVVINADDFTGKKITKITVSRNDYAAAYSTLMLPVEVKVKEAINDGKDDHVGKVDAAYLPTGYNSVDKTMDFVIQETIEANKPYLVHVSGSPQRFVFENASGYSVVATSATVHSVTLENSCWEFTGTYETIHWQTSPGNVYGYAAKTGKFVKVGTNVNVFPLRAYLTCSQPNQLNGLGKVAATEPLPDVINVRFLDKDGGTLSIGKMNTRTGEIQMQDRYYDLKGRKLNGKPQNKIMYVNKKVIKH